MLMMTLPLRGEWMTPNTPGSRVPSHGTDRFGARYAYDFIQVDWARRGMPAYRGSLVQYLLRGMEVERYYCWEQPVFAPCDGIVVKVANGWQDRLRTNLRKDLRSARENERHFDPHRDNMCKIAGNHVVICYDKNMYVALCHLQMGSIVVQPGQTVLVGTLLGKVGNSGNSYMPHLHFQVMNSMDIATAQGIPCAFDRYEIWEKDHWHPVEESMPKHGERIRFI